MRKMSPKTMRRKALALWSILVRHRDGNACLVCKSAEYIQAHHIEDKRNESLRYALANGASLCARHHFGGSDSAHHSPVYFLDWLQTNRPYQLVYVRQHRTDKPESLADAYARLQSLDFKRTTGQQ